jgi:hypothetical protein
VFLGEKVFGRSIHNLIKESVMNWSVIADWMMILFLLWYGLKTFVPALNKGTATYIGGILALGAAITTFVGRGP